MVDSNPTRRKGGANRRWGILISRWYTESYILVARWSVEYLTKEINMTKEIRVHGEGQKQTVIRASVLAIGRARDRQFVAPRPPIFPTRKSARRLELRLMSGVMPSAVLCTRRRFAMCLSSVEDAGYREKPQRGEWQSQSPPATSRLRDRLRSIPPQCQPVRSTKLWFQQSADYSARTTHSRLLSIAFGSTLARRITNPPQTRSPTQSGRRERRGRR